ncbi:putative Polysaccharide biosynthesis protein,epimerase/dehydratase [Vibrio nigripulchritudo SO65]|uniref:polysaccharide biosynthesis protein n=1 Tax=Vibrio nigripulchritudo TaxID=28173 RepID=UPI0003B1D9DF|nr:nucleoside-diphosphate sugar epimerase/dehydratase [Vibrio nigripulchritudo]CCN35105.1 putative Polysaccharide biosynthesis protein,epimerase/dehydratase [Vibrio nigripulchritudo AM115]CCN41699.1 putative Polysaccharide biosynthesis protein,epimerase/dehydratase [Vibrio nigripulchritudo FTn2]CCN65078.1 putative Polysaccharide biosynthesis protein,epimerase/dehydratase [Vibrio nigripulchritudo POn4]CCN75185.1 putative Polysaccharide biosynthesis protein,epimerase/dehydratase [Vibrio nigripulc
MSNFNVIWSLPRHTKRLISLLFDLIFICISFFGAYWVRIGNFEPLPSVEGRYVLIITLALTLLVFIKLGLYRAVLRYLGLHVLALVGLGTALSAITMAGLAFWFDASIPRSVPIIYGAFLAISVGGSRLIVRSLVAQSSNKAGNPVLIYGAGSAGRQLALALRQSDSHNVVGFMDEDTTLQNTMLMGLYVYTKADAEQVIAKHGVKQILLAIPSASRRRRKEVIDGISLLPVEILTVPEMSDIVAGNASIDELKDVSIDDLLGRDPVAPQQALMEANIKDKVVMVTGAGGSIGSELCRQIIQNQPRCIVLFELSEFGLYKIDRELSLAVEAESLDVQIIPLLGSVQRINRLSKVMKSFKVQTVYHAAAYKHVPLVEFNVVEGVRNNVFGTNYTARAAIEASVESFVLISTDKAVRPTNVMGATKRMAELGLQALADEQSKNLENNPQNGTRFCMVRFGNVLGSSGSVVPVFKRQIANREPITVTHEDITRYFMTIPEAAQLVIQAGAMGKGGDVFVLDMGESVKIVDLAKNLIHLSGLEVKDESNPYGDIEIKYTGLRPGEKLYEELLIGDNVDSTAHERIMTANEDFLPNEEYVALLNKLDTACHDFDHEAIRQLLLDTPTGFAPVDGIGDLVWKVEQKKP